MKLVVFDLDGTLTESKQMITLKTMEQLKDLIDTKTCHIAVASGAGVRQFRTQLIGPLDKIGFPTEKLYLITTNGAQIWYNTGKWNTLYPSYMLSGEDVRHITRTITDVLSSLDEFKLEKDIVSFGPRIENRQSQVTFSALGQRAPIEFKKRFDPDQKKRRVLQNKLIPLLPEYDIKIGGTTSIDITMKGVSKVSGLYRVMELLSVKKEDVLYVGDALYEGGNDHCVKEAGFLCADVQSPFETEGLLGRLVYPYLYVQPEGGNDHLWRLRDGECESDNHIMIFPGGKTPTKICLGCGKPNDMG